MIFEIIVTSGIVGLFAFVAGMVHRDHVFQPKILELKEELAKAKIKNSVLIEQHKKIIINWQEEYMFLQLISGVSSWQIEFWKCRMRKHIKEANPMIESFEDIDYLIYPHVSTAGYMIDPVGSKDYWDPVEICKRDKMLNLIYYKKSISEGQIKEMQDACTKTSQEIRKEKFFKSHTLLKEEFVFFEDIENRVAYYQNNDKNNTWIAVVCNGDTENITEIEGPLSKHNPLEDFKFYMDIRGK